MHARTDRALPSNRGQLCARTLSLLLGGGVTGVEAEAVAWGRRAVSDPDLAELLLESPALRLTEMLGGEEWCLQVLVVDATRCAADSGLAVFGPAGIWKGPRAFLAQVARRSGVLGEHAGESHLTEALIQESAPVLSHPSRPAGDSMRFHR